MPGPLTLRHKGSFCFLPLFRPSLGSNCMTPRRRHLMLASFCCLLLWQPVLALHPAPRAAPALGARRTAPPARAVRHDAPRMSTDSNPDSLEDVFEALLKVRSLGWIVRSLGWIVRSLGWIVRSLGWIVRSLGWVVRSLGWIVRSLGWIGLGLLGLFVALLKARPLGWIGRVAAPAS